MADAPRPHLPPFTRETAAKKVQAAEDAWNTHDPVKVAGAYSEDSVWRNRDQFVTGRDEIVKFLTQKWERELDYSLRKNLWAFDWVCPDGYTPQLDDNDNWVKDDNGIPQCVEASILDDF